MSLEDERELMKGLESKAVKGQILSGKDVRKIVEQKVNKVVSDDYIWDLFKRNGWTKHSPRPHHPNKDIEKQEAFKKNSKTIWLPLKMILNPS
jgi:transposase